MSKNLLPLLGLLLIALLLILKATVQTRSTDCFYRASGKLSAWQNGLALAGDYLSAAAFLGATGLMVERGYDALVYAVGTLAGWPLLLLLLADKLRESGRFTVADVLASRFPGPGIRHSFALSTLLIVMFYLIVQLVGAGKLLELLFGIAYIEAVLLVGGLTILTVGLGGMLATTWIQMLKASLLIACALVLSIGVLSKSGFSLSHLLQQAASLQTGTSRLFLPSPALSNPWEVISLGLGLVLGLLGLPHILIRFYTVRDTAAARRSACWATGLIALFFTFNLVIGAGAIVHVSHNPALPGPHGSLPGGNNMAIIHLARLIGGPLLQDIVCSIVFATILAVVAGLTLAGTSSICHDVFTPLAKQPGPASLRPARLATILLVLIALLLSTAFQQQNIAVLMGLAFALAASGPCPALLLGLFWPGLTAKGAIAANLAGIISAALMILFGPAVWVAHFGFAQPVFPLENPALCSVPLALLAAWIVSRHDPVRRKPREVR